MQNNGQSEVGIINEIFIWASATLFDEYNFIVAIKKENWGHKICLVCTSFRSKKYLLIIHISI